MLEFNTVDVHLRDGTTCSVPEVASLQWENGLLIVWLSDGRTSFPIDSILFTEEYTSHE